MIHFAFTHNEHMGVANEVRKATATWLRDDDGKHLGYSCNECGWFSAHPLRMEEHLSWELKR